MKAITSDISTFVSPAGDSPVEVSGALSGRDVESAAQVCWIEMKQYSYQPGHQVELLHLQAEADALLLQLQTMHQRRLSTQPLNARA